VDEAGVEAGRGVEDEGAGAAEEEGGVVGSVRVTPTEAQS
jgi:hypothetical protein